MTEIRTIRSPNMKISAFGACQNLNVWISNVYCTYVYFNLDVIYQGVLKHSDCWFYFQLKLNFILNFLFLGCKGSSLPLSKLTICFPLGNAEKQWNFILLAFLLVHCKLRQLGLPNQMVDNSDSKSSEVNRQYWSDSKSNEEIISSIAITILF